MRNGKAALLVSAAFLLSAAAPSTTLVIPDGIGQSPPGPVVSLNPLIDSSVASLQARLLLYRPLVWIGQDGGFDRDRSLAESITPGTDDLTFHVVLKPWLWSDGRRVTADDVVFGFSLITRLSKAGLFAYEGQGGMPGQVAYVRAVDETHVDITLTHPANPAWFILDGLSLLYALPRHAWGDPSVDQMLQGQNDPAFFRVVDGPFLLQRLKLDRYASFTPNPLYGGHHATIGRLVIDFVPGGSPLRAIQAGELDMADVPLALREHLRGTPGYTFHTLPAAFGFAAMMLNLRNDHVAFLRDPRIRQALSDASDQRKMVALAFHGMSHEQRAPAPVTPAATTSPAIQAGTLPVRYDPALAARLLDTAGWRAGPDGVRRNHGQALSFTSFVPSGNAGWIQEAQIMQQDLRRIGVELKLKLIAANQMFATLLGGDATAWEAGIGGWTYSGVPDGRMFFGTDQPVNIGGYTDPTMDRMLNDSVEKPGRDALFGFQDYAAAQQPWIFLPDCQYLLMVADGVAGVEDFLNPQGFWSPEYLRLTAAPPPAGTP